MTKNIYIIVGVILVVAVLAFFNYSRKTEAPISQLGEDQQITSSEESLFFGISIPLISEVDSKIKGGFDVFEDEGKVKVIISIVDISNEEPSPVHLHSGSCDSLGEIVFPLNSIVKGISQTILNVSVDEFKTEFPLMVNIHKSENEMNINTLCRSISE